jgi:hypothetical protein
MCASAGSSGPKHSRKQEAPIAPDRFRSGDRRAPISAQLTIHYTCELIGRWYWRSSIFLRDRSARSCLLTLGVPDDPALSCSSRRTPRAPAAGCFKALLNPTSRPRTGSTPRRVPVPSQLLQSRTRPRKSQWMRVLPPLDRHRICSLCLETAQDWLSDAN